MISHGVATKQKLVLFALLLIFPFFFNCQGKKKDEVSLKAVVANFLASSEEVFAYGFVDLEEIMNRVELDPFQNIGGFVVNQLLALEEGLDLSQKIYLAFEGSVNYQGTPETSYAFVRILDKAKLEVLMSDLGLYFYEIDGVKYFENESFSIAYSLNNLVVVYSKNQLEREQKAKKVLEKLSEEQESPHFEEKLNSVSNLYLVGDIAKMYQSLDTVIQKQLLADSLFKSGEILCNLNFNSESIDVTVDYSDIPPKLKELIPFKNEFAQKFQLAGGFDGTQTGSFSLALDMEKVDELMQLLPPETAQSFYEFFGTFGKLVKGVADGHLSNLFGGTVSMLTFSENKDLLKNELILAFDLGKEYQNIIDAIHSLSEGGGIKSLKNEFYSYESTIFQLKDKQIILYLKGDNIEMFKQSKAQLVPGVSNAPLFFEVKTDMLVQYLGLSLGELTAGEWVKVEADYSKLSVKFDLNK